MSKRKLFFDATPLIDKHVSGVGKVLQETLRVLDTKQYTDKYDIYIFVPMDERKKAQELGYQYIKTKWLPYPHKFFSLFTRLRFGPPIDIFLGKGVYIFENYRNWNLLFSKSITYIHDMTFHLFPRYVQMENLIYLQKYINVWLNRADKIVTISETSKREIEQQLDVKNVDVVMNAVNIDDFYPRPQQEINTVIRRWKIPNSYFVFLGNIEPRKNLINTIRAFRSYVKNSETDDSLVIIGGGGWKNDEIIDEINAIRKQGVSIVRPDGYVPDEDLPALLSGAKALLQFSWHEGFGLPVLQALACGTPVAAANIPALREVAKGNEKNIVYAAPDNIVELREAIVAAGKKQHTDKPQNIQTWQESVVSLEQIIDNL